MAKSGAIYDRTIRGPSPLVEMVPLLSPLYVGEAGVAVPRQRYRI
jgi:hypothetical protein